MSEKVSIDNTVVEKRFKNYFKKVEVINSVKRQFILFILIGSICFILDMAMLLFLVEIAGLEIVLSTGIAVIIAIYAAYVLNKRYIFESGKHKNSKEIILFFIFSILGFFMNIGLMYIAITYLLLWYVPSKAAITIIIAVFNFSTRKKIIFIK